MKEGGRGARKEWKRLSGEGVGGRGGGGGSGGRHGCVLLAACKSTFFDSDILGDCSRDTLRVHAKRSNRARPPAQTSRLAIFTASTWPRGSGRISAGRSVRHPRVVFTALHLRAGTCGYTGDMMGRAVLPPRPLIFLFLVFRFSFPMHILPPTSPPACMHL